MADEIKDDGTDVFEHGEKWLAEACAAPVAEVGLPERPKPLQVMVTGKRVKTFAYGIKAASEYTTSAEAYMDALEARVAALDAENQRLLDLARHQRHELLDADLISMDEFTALVQDSDSGLRVARLETYDQIKTQLAEALKDKEMWKTVAEVGTEDQL